MPLAKDSLAAKDIAYNLHPYTDLAVHEQKGPLIMTRGRGIYLWDSDEKQYIDGFAGLWCAALGFSETHQRVHKRFAAHQFVAVQ